MFGGGGNFVWLNSLSFLLQTLAVLFHSFPGLFIADIFLRMWAKKHISMSDNTEEINSFWTQCLMHCMSALAVDLLWFTKTKSCIHYISYCQFFCFVFCFQLYAYVWEHTRVFAQKYTGRCSSVFVSVRLFASFTNTHLNLKNWLCTGSWTLSSPLKFACKFNNFSFDALECFGCYITFSSHPLSHLFLC